MAIQWTNELATGSTKIDMQDLAIFERINNMLEACNQGKGRSEVKEMLTFLEEYVMTHFSTEEQLMKEARYPGCSDHRALHHDFIRKLTQLKKKVENEGIGVHTVIATNQLVVSWFVEHIRKVDTQFGSFLRERAQNPR